eukprot:GHVP01038966.1.p1 GENE.GHVP01038966.1~~GHVP01038966.1.p1  ORF type:complete len:302 (+),score=74.66 GHVP01038966.1:415-1320(+)
MSNEEYELKLWQRRKQATDEAERLARQAVNSLNFQNINSKQKAQLKLQMQRQIRTNENGETKGQLSRKNGFSAAALLDESPRDGKSTGRSTGRSTGHWKNQEENCQPFSAKDVLWFEEQKSILSAWQEKLELEEKNLQQEWGELELRCQELKEKEATSAAVFTSVQEMLSEMENKAAILAQYEIECETKCAEFEKKLQDAINQADDLAHRNELLAAINSKLIKDAEQREEERKSKAKTKRKKLDVSMSILLAEIISQNKSMEKSEIADVDDIERPLRITNFQEMFFLPPPPAETEFFPDWC